jgi:hypothetical protein
VIIPIPIWKKFSVEKRAQTYSGSKFLLGKNTEQGNDNKRFSLTSPNQICLPISCSATKLNTKIIHQMAYSATVSLRGCFLRTTRLP